MMRQRRKKEVRKFPFGEWSFFLAGRIGDFLVLGSFGI
jgi:hypothetical protein